jgi:ADP-ribose pyrophosphatase
LSRFIEERISGEVVYAGNFIQVHRDVVRLPDGTQATRDYIQHPGAVAIVALTDAGEVILERQYRYPLRRELVEIPAGKLEAGEAHLETGKRELLEETGYSAANWTYLGLFHNAIGYSDEGIELWLATGLTKGEAKLDVGEFLEVFRLPFDEALAMAADGRISDVKTIVGLFWTASRRQVSFP